MNDTKAISRRWTYLAVGIVGMLFAGVLYAWSILKSPLAAEFGWGTSQLALNFTLAMSFFCIGGLVGAQLAKRAGHRVALAAAGVLSALGFGLTATLSGSSVAMLYLTYGVLAGLGIGIAYNVLISTVSAWFPDKKGLCSGCLMMGFGASALVLGNAADAMFQSTLGWRTTYVVVGLAICLVLVAAGLLLKKPGADQAFPQPKVVKAAGTETFETRDYTTFETIRRPSFWMAFVCISFLAAVGSSVISFAKDLALSVSAPEALAVTLVGVLSVCNGLGRILTGAVYDIIGRRKTMLCANVLTICAAGVTLLAVNIGSLPLCIAGLCLTGMSYGACPTVMTAFTASFYGMKYLSTNVAIMTFTVMVGSLIAMVSNKVLEVTGGYPATFMMLLALTFAALVLNVMIKKP
ncbi:MAG: MFS transporter [Ruminiclostridium sp.]|nr:MFS transporter [Ruminiclostridium sp.]MBQ9933123.1 MFS transporter [Ruminiclostridium sp.]